MGDGVVFPVGIIAAEVVCGVFAAVETGVHLREEGDHSEADTIEEDGICGHIELKEVGVFGEHLAEGVFGAVIGKDKGFIDQVRFVEVTHEVAEGRTVELYALFEEADLVGQLFHLIVLIEVYGATHLYPHLAPIIGEVARATVIKEDDTTIIKKEIIAGVGIAIKQAVEIKGTEIKTIKQAGDAVSDFFVGLCGQPLVKALAFVECGGEDAACGVCVVYFGDDDPRVLREDFGKAALIVGFFAVVAFIEEAFFEFLEDGFGVGTKKQHLLKEAEKLAVAEVGLHGVFDAGVLDLDGDGSSVVKGGAMDLADGCRCKGLSVKGREEFFGIFAEFIKELILQLFPRHRWSVALKNSKGFAGFRRQDIAEITKHLPQLHRSPAHLGKGLHHLEGEGLGRFLFAFFVFFFRSEGAFGFVGEPSAAARHRETRKLHRASEAACAQCFSLRIKRGFQSDAGLFVAFIEQSLQMVGDLFGGAFFGHRKVSVGRKCRGVLRTPLPQPRKISPL